MYRKRLLPDGKGFDNQYLTIKLGADRVGNEFADEDINRSNNSLLINVEI